MILFGCGRRFPNFFRNGGCAETGAVEFVRICSGATELVRTFSGNGTRRPNLSNFFGGVRICPYFVSGNGRAAELVRTFRGGVRTCPNLYSAEFVCVFLWKRRAAELVRTFFGGGRTCPNFFSVESGGGGRTCPSLFGELVRVRPNLFSGKGRLAVICNYDIIIIWAVPGVF